MNRLQAYGLFSPDTLRVIEEVARKQAKAKSYQEYFRLLGMPEPQLYIGSKKRGVPVIDIAPRKKPTAGTIIVHLPMANPLDENQLFHIATIAAALPKYRIISFGNPSGKPYKYRAQNRSLAQLIAIAFTQRRASLVRPEIEYLRQQGVTAAHHVGYSYGVHKALIGASYLENSEVASLILVDPVAHTRGVRQLINDFRSTFTPMGEYVNRTRTQIYFDARRETSKTKHSMSALRRPISVALGIMLARLDFIPFLKELVARNTRIKVFVAWGSKSELGNDEHMKTSLDELARYSKRVEPLRLKDDAHAMANDVHLYAALVYEALQRYNAK